jgi:hypothetical protein
LWSYTSTLPYIFMECWTRHGQSFIFTMCGSQRLRFLTTLMIVWGLHK